MLQCQPKRNRGSPNTEYLPFRPSFSIPFKPTCLVCVLAHLIASSKAHERGDKLTQSPVVYFGLQGRSCGNITGIDPLFALVKQGILSILSAVHID